MKRSEKWYPCNSGGKFRKWYGNEEIIVNWQNDGNAIRNFKDANGNLRSRPQNTDFFFKSGVTWTKLSSGNFSARLRSESFIFDDTGRSAFPSVDFSKYSLLGLMCSSVGAFFLKILNPSMSFTSGDVANLPVPQIVDETWEFRVQEIIEIAKTDWDFFENSWNFRRNPMLLPSFRQSNLEYSYTSLRDVSRKMTGDMQSREKENNLLYLHAFRLEDEISADAELSQITLSCNPIYRYGVELAEIEREERFKSDTMRELISYAIGCVMGRYSLAEPGLIYAHSGGVDFDPDRYGKLPADEDGITPITEDTWFEDDAASRIEEFMGVVWPEAPLMETLRTLTDGLTMGKGGEPRDALRSYLSKQFFKDHLQTYKNRPIYWLFSSGKQKAFEALVYLHRYNEGTLARMRTNYVTPLMGKLQQRMSDLEGEVASSASSAEKARKTKEKDRFGKQLVELRRFDEEIRHLADQRIAIDLDDGVKVNYAKFGNLLSGVDKICGKDKDD